MIIGIVGDTHLGCTDFSHKRRADFSKAFCNAIEKCREQGAEAVCLLGDVFDSAATRRNVDAFAELLREISVPISILKRNNIPLIAIPGNHEYGRGREGGELAVLEHLEFAIILRGTDINLGQVKICGVPWQNAPAEISTVVNKLRRKSTNGQRQVLLLHNFIKGSQHLPADLCEVDPATLEGFDQVFVGHHHVYESIVHCTIPGSTEIQNMLDKSDKCVLIYDSDTNKISRHLLPKTHEVLILRYDVSALSAKEILARLSSDLDSHPRYKQPFVYIDVRGTIEGNQPIEKVELASVLREHDLFDYCIDLHYFTRSKSASDSQRGASIEQILRRAFPGKELAKANGTSPMTKAKSCLLIFGREYFLIIKSISIDGFRSFSNARLDFVPGQNYIVGHNWQGKSSIVDAIGLALFGLDVFPKKVAGTAVSADHLINESGRKAKVQLEFVLNGTHYIIERILPGRSVTLSNGGSTAATGTKTVAEKLNSLLGVDAKLFQNIFYSDQDELRKSLEFSPEERRVFIERLLGVEEWKQKIDFFRAARRSLESFLQDLTAGRLGAFLSHVEELQYDVEKQRGDLQDLRQSVRNLERSSPRNMGALRAAEKESESAIGGLQDQQTKLQTTLAIEEHLSRGVRKGRCPTCTQAIPRSLRVSRLKILNRTIRDLRSELNKIDRQLQKLEARFSRLDYDQSYENVAELREAKTRYDAARNQLTKDEERLAKLRIQAKTFGKKPQQVESAKAEIGFLQRIEDAIHDFRRVLRKRLVKQLMIGTNDLLTRFHDGDNDSIVKIDEELNIAVQLHGRSVPIFNLSGAAKDILALALRYGLLRVAAGGINFFILDEPTRHMDPSNCQKLKGLFNDLLDFQLIVVTVNSEFSDATGRHFRVAKDESFHSVIAESW